MDKSADTGRTLAQSLEWINTFLDYTDKVCESVPEDKLDLRFTDPQDRYFFSARELAMHIADSRFSALSWINGEDYSSRKFQVEFGGKDKPWTFRDGVTREDILASLADSRSAIAAELTRPATDALVVTDSLEKSFEQRIAFMKEKGDDTSQIEANGPSCIANALIFMAAHEQAHRGELQWLMRVNGVEVFRFI